jgi:hypothetical protein
LLLPGRNVGQTETRSVFIELKEPRGSAVDRRPQLGPTNP